MEEDMTLDEEIKQATGNCCFKMCVLFCVYLWCLIFLGLCSFPLSMPLGIEVVDLQLNATVTDWPSTYAWWIGAPSSFLLLSCCCCCICCCCAPDRPEKWDGEGADGAEVDWTRNRSSLGWLIDASERFSASMPRNSRAQRMSSRFSSRLSRRIESAERFSARFSARMPTGRSSRFSRSSARVRGFQSSTAGSACTSCVMSSRMSEGVENPPSAGAPPARVSRSSSANAGHSRKLSWTTGASHEAAGARRIAMA